MLCFASLLLLLFHLCPKRKHTHTNRLPYTLMVQGGDFGSVFVATAILCPFSLGWLYNLLWMLYVFKTRS
uniref:Secreted protein n=1 Tax=Anopheles darlingi TaxID=43151 RepID=A0A2M4D2I2_ANODA